MSEKTPLENAETKVVTEEATVAETAENSEETKQNPETDSTKEKSKVKKIIRAFKAANAKYKEEKAKEKNGEAGDDEEKAKKKKKNKPKDVKGTSKRLIGYITEHKRMLIVVAVCVILSTIIGVCASLIMQPIYKILEDVVIKGVTDREGSMAGILKYLIIMSCAYALSATLTLIYTRIMLNVSIKTVLNLRRDLFNHLQGLPIGFFDKHQTGEIMSRFTSDVTRVNDLVSNTFPTIISATIQAVMTITIMIIYSWQITLTITVAIIFMVLVVLVITALCSPLFKKQQKAMGACNGYVEEYINGIKAVKVFCYEETSKKRFFELNEDYRKIGVKANIIGGFMGPLMAMITRVNYAVSVSLGALLVIKGKMTVPKLIVYLQYAQGYGSPIASLAACYSTFISALAGAERIFEVLDTPFETDEGKITLAKVVKGIMGYEETEDEGISAWKIPGENGDTYVPVKCDIDIKDLTFAYVEGTDVIKHINTSAKSGEKLAFVGSTGAGKTTITNLINRFYEIENGDITIDGISIKDIKKADLRNSMAFVLQDSKLFAGTIAENIRYGKLDATDEEVIAAAKLANADSFIEKLPDGYDTEIRSDGVNISAGQSQLLNIARAAIANRPLLVLDEATSSVDTRTERLIEIGMDKLMEGKTVLVIAHRLSTVRNSDDIVVLESGEIIEHGNHSELIALGKKYYQLYTGMFEMT